MLVDIDKLSPTELRKIARDKEAKDENVTVGYLNKNLFSIFINTHKTGLSYGEYLDLIEILKKDVIKTHKIGDLFVYDSEYDVWDDIKGIVKFMKEDWADQNLENITTIKSSELVRFKK
jgi:predicted DNA binding CopG/RHH family protein